MTFWASYFYCSLVFYIYIYIYIYIFFFGGGGVNKTIIPLALVGYEMIIANSAPEYLYFVWLRFHSDNLKS